MPKADTFFHRYLGFSCLILHLPFFWAEVVCAHVHKCANRQSTMLVKQRVTFVEGAMFIFAFCLQCTGSSEDDSVSEQAQLQSQVEDLINQIDSEKTMFKVSLPLASIPATTHANMATSRGGKKGNKKEGGKSTESGLVKGLEGVVDGGVLVCPGCALTCGDVSVEEVRWPLANRGSLWVEGIFDSKSWWRSGRSWLPRAYSIGNGSLFLQSEIIPNMYLMSWTRESLQQPATPVYGKSITTWIWPVIFPSESRMFCDEVLPVHYRST